MLFRSLVREFYLNLSYYNGTVKFSVKGVNIILDPLHLGQILHLSCEGYSHMELPIKEEGLSVILGRAFTKNLNKLEARILSVEMRLLHHMVTKLFVPRSGRHDLLSGRDICIMYHVIIETSLNLPTLMIEAMREILNRSKAHLPYGMALTLVFRRFGVYFEEETVTRLSHSDTINCHTLHRMNFSKTDGGWSKGVEERAKKEGPSSPCDHRASPDIQFVLITRLSLRVSEEGCFCTTIREQSRSFRGQTYRQSD